MNIKKKYRVILIALLAFFMIWGILVAKFNLTIKKENQLMPIKKYENIGEWIPFGSNYMVDAYCDGYSIRIDDLRIVEYETYMEELLKLGYQEDSMQDINVQKVLEVEVTLKNEDNTDKGIDFLSTWLLGKDFYVVLSTKWFEAVNSLKDNSMGGIRLRTNTEYKLKLPYPLTELTYREKIGRKIEKEELWLCLTRYPQERWARVQ